MKKLHNPNKLSSYPRKEFQEIGGVPENATVTRIMIRLQQINKSLEEANASLVTTRIRLFGSFPSQTSDAVPDKLSGGFFSDVDAQLTTIAHAVAILSDHVAMLDAGTQS